MENQPKILSHYKQTVYLVVSLFQLSYTLFLMNCWLKHLQGIESLYLQSFNI